MSIHAFLFCNAFWGGWDGSVNAEKAAQFGDFIGGYIGTVFALIGVLLLVITLLEQIQKDKDDGFEQRFFQLLDYHRQNVLEIGIGGKKGLRTFVVLVREFREALTVVQKACQQAKPALTQTQTINLAYMAFYYGTGPNSSRVLAAALANSNYDQALVATIISKLDDPAQKKSVRQNRQFTYEPFEGHQSRLGHYFRHLYQMACYIDKNAGGRADEFADLLRAQLSNHEQALLCLNSLSNLGAAWKQKGLIQKYHFIKNLPEDFFDPKKELDVASIYPDVDFEYKKSHGTDRDPNRDIR